LEPNAGEWQKPEVVEYDAESEPEEENRVEPVDQLSSIINNIDLNSTEKNIDELPPPPSHPPKLVREQSMQAPRRKTAPQAPRQRSATKKGVSSLFKV
jgi:hypothetical protein